MLNGTKKGGWKCTGQLLDLIQMKKENQVKERNQKLNERNIFFGS